MPPDVACFNWKEVLRSPHCSPANEDELARCSRCWANRARESGAGIRRGADAGLLTRERELEQLIAAKADLQTRLLSGKYTQAEAAAVEKELAALMMELDQMVDC